MSTIRIRRALPTDAEAVARLANALNVAMGEQDNIYTPRHIRDLAFGVERRFDLLVAEADDRVVGYASVEDTVNTDTAEPAIFLLDLMVDEDLRGHGVGRDLMAAVARLARERGATSVWWGVLESNDAARRFYECLGARDPKVRLMTLDGAALAALAQRRPACDQVAPAAKGEI